MSMKAHKLDVNVADDRRIAITLPEDFPPRPAEVIVLAVPPMKRRLVRVLGSLASAAPPPPEGDPIADALAEFRRTRNPG